MTAPGPMEIATLRVPDYPRHLETYWLERLRQHYGTRRPAQAMDKILRVIRDLADTFTLERGAGMEAAYLTPEQIIAYGLFFFPRNHVRTLISLEEITRRGWTPPVSPRVLDLGCGTGAAALAAVHHPAFSGTTPKFTAVDRVEGHLAELRRLTRHHPRNAWTFHHAGIDDESVWAPRPNHRWDLILLAYSYNEFCTGSDPGGGPLLVDRLLSRLNPGGMLLLIEPALKETATGLQELRDHLAARSRCHIWAPCLHAARCPLLAKGTDWCHEVRPWNPPGYLLELNQSLHRDINHLKFSFLALSRSAPPSAPPLPGYHRLVSPVNQTRGRWLWTGCAADGGLHQFDILTRGLDKEQWFRPPFARGDILSITNPKPLGGENQWRAPGL